ncbi:MAG: hypothetical protein IBJ09_06325 [Bacteroidia bacterium]|nr:hypothetical protein [Bacteroidia bacterium]
MKELLNRYLAGETTRKEEETLKRFYAAHPELEESMYFSDLEQYRSSAVQETQPPKERRTLSLVLWPATAVAAAILFAFVLLDRPSSTESADERKYVSEVLVSEDVRGEITDEQLALQQTEKALAFVSRKMNKGLKGMNKMKKFQEGVDKIEASAKPKNNSNEK